MQFTNKKASYGVTKQLIDMSFRAFIGLVALYFAVFFGFRYLIDYFVPRVGDYDLNHKLKDLLTCLDIILCFLIYLGMVIKFIKEKLSYIKYLIDCVHFMRGGTFNEPTKIQGNDEISHLAIHIDELRQQIHTNQTEAETKALKHNQLLTSISHDLRTPLTSLIGYLEILMDRDFGDNHKEKRHLSLCLSRSLQLQELTNSAFEHFYLTDKESQSIELLRCNSILGLKDIILDRAQLLNQKNFMYEIEIPSKRYALVYDIRMMERLFDNIFTNIVRYGKANSTVIIYGKIQDSSLVISIINNIEVCCKRSESTGIGIKNCKKIMKLHGGNFCSIANNALFTATVTLPIQNNISILE